MVLFVPMVTLTLVFLNIFVMALVSQPTYVNLNHFVLLPYADDVNILGGSVHTVKKNAETFVAATKEIGLEVNADKAKYMIMSRDQNAGRGHSMKIDNSPTESVECFKYLGTMLTNQNSIQEESKSSLKLGNACYYSAQNLLSSRLLLKI